jgi:hypothetical protein
LVSAFVLSPAAQMLAPMHKHDHDRCVVRLTVHRMGLIIHELRSRLRTGLPCITLTSGNALTGCLVRAHIGRSSADCGTSMSAVGSVSQMALGHRAF